MKPMKTGWIGVVCWLAGFVLSQAANPTFRRTEGDQQLLLRLMEQDAFFHPYLEHAGDYAIQLIYTQIDRDKQGNPTFTQHTYRLNGKEYFNPASLVKWPLILLCMDKINSLKQRIPEISLYNKVEYLGDTPCSPHVTQDLLAADKTPRLANYIKEMILVSDDNAYNRMYDFLGQEYINRRLPELGYDSLRVMARFAPCSPEQNRRTPAVCFYDRKGKLIHRQAEAVNPAELSNPLGHVLVGRAHLDAKGMLVNCPKDYSRFNRMSLQDINDLMLHVFFREAVPEGKRFNLTEEDYELLCNYTAMYPSESEFPAFRSNRKRYPAHLKKYLYYGKDSSRPEVPGLKIHNMVGESHGTLSDVAWFVNEQAGVEFMLAAVINTCSDGIIAPSHYHYADKGQPFLAKLGQLIYEYELKRNAR